MHDCYGNFCQICDLPFSKSGDFGHHMTSIHEILRPFNCQVCDFSFLKYSYLLWHVIKEKHIQPQYFYKCGVCQKSLGGSLSAHNVHVQTVHQGKKLFQCHKCYLIFASQAAKKHHQKLVHEDVKHQWKYSSWENFKTKHTCEICTQYGDDKGINV